MINNKQYSDLLVQYRTQCKLVCESKNLEELKDNYIVSTNILQSIIQYIESHVIPDDYESEIRQLDMTTVHTWLSLGGIPNWDSAYDPNETYELYENYFQRYGCFGIDCVVSWDETNIVLSDGETTQIVMRPDVLMSSLK